MVPSPAVRYHVDGDDRLDAFNDAWTAFAEQNDGRALLPDRIRGRALWEFISDPATAHLYKAMMKRIRSDGQKVEFQFRCDSPDRRRLLHMEISSGSSNGIVFSVTPVQEEARTPVAVLDATRARTNEFLAVCAWCMRVRLSPGIWVRVEEAVRGLSLFEGDAMPKLTHSICESCSAAVMPLLADKSVGTVTLGSLGED